MIRPGDMVLVLLCAALVGAAYHVAWQPGEKARAAMIRSPGEPGRRISLESEREVTVPGPRGPTRIAVRPGGARFLSSPCPAKYCIHAGWLDRAGDFAACLPNGISLTLLGGREGYDGIGY